jgi:hypothetical protein
MWYPPHRDVQGGKERPQRQEQEEEGQKDPVPKKVLKMSQNQSAVTLSLACIVSQQTQRHETFESKDIRISGAAASRSRLLRPFLQPALRKQFRCTNIAAYR